MKCIDVTDVIYQNDGIIVDIRKKFDFENGTIPGAINIPKSILIREYERLLDKKTRYYLLCNSGHNSDLVSNYLNKLGYDTLNIIGGYNQYIKLQKRGI